MNIVRGLYTNNAYLDFDFARHKIGMNMVIPMRKKWPHHSDGLCGGDSNGKHVQSSLFKYGFWKCIPLNSVDAWSTMENSTRHWYECRKSYSPNGTENVLTVKMKLLQTYE